MLNFKTNYLPLLIFILASCSNIQFEQNLNMLSETKAEVETQDIQFEAFLANQWDEGLKDSPIFASNLGDKRFNTKISSNSIDQFKVNKAK
jgi:hypothetical protein